MSDVNSLTGQDTPASSEVQQQVTATAQTETPPSDSQTEGSDGKEPAVPKTYTEEEVRDRVERAKAKAAAIAERRAYREALGTLASQQQEGHHQPDNTPPRPQRDNYATQEQYEDSLMDWRDAQRDAQSQKNQRQTEVQKLNDANQKVVDAASKLPGFDADVFEELPISHAMAAAIRESDVGPKVVAHLTSNPDEADRIAKLTPARQIAEIGKLEIKLSQVVQKTTLPKPITPVGGSGGASTGKNFSNASYSDFKELMKKSGSRWVR